MKNIQKGERHQLSDLFMGDQSPVFTIEVDTAFSGIPKDGLDISVFCLNANKKMDSEHDIIFFNNANSLGREVALLDSHNNVFEISIPNIQQAGNRVQSIVVCAAIDNSYFAGTFGTAFAHPANCIKLTLKYRGQVIANTVISHKDVANEKALTLFEFYIKSNVWRLTNVTQGFNGGMRELIIYYGGRVADAPVPQPINNGFSNHQANNQQQWNQPNQQQWNQANNQQQWNQQNNHQQWNHGQTPGLQGGNNQYQTGYGQNQSQPFQQQRNAVSLKKDKVLNSFQKQAPKLVSLAKNSLVVMENKNILGLEAKVALVLDASGSMNRQYSRGDVQQVVERLMPVASAFDDDGTFECWAFAERTYQLDDVNLGNLNNYIDITRGGWRNWRVGSRVNNEVDALNAVIEFYAANNPKRLPVFVLFISDGGVHSDTQIAKAIRDSTSLPIFWQFVGLGGASYGILERLDTLAGRSIDNCNFFSLDNIQQLNDSEIYEHLLNEFPIWLREAQRMGLIHSNL